MIKICVAGATGRMGSTLLKEACGKSNFQIVGAVTSPDNENLGKTLSSSGICDSNVVLKSPEELKEALRDADVYISFTTPEAEMENLPIVADSGVKIVMGTTGFSDYQISRLKEYVSIRVPAVFAPNFAIGVNILFKLLLSLGALPEDYDFSIVEMHHTGKRDAPSGTAKKIADIISKLRNYQKIVHGRSGVSLREKGELEVSSIRAGGIPGIHNVIVAGKYEMINIEHVSFSRSVFAQGALYAAEWIYGVSKPGIYSMEDVLS